MEYKTMRRAVGVVISHFPSIARDVKHADTNSDALISKIRKVWNNSTLVRCFMLLYAWLMLFQIMQGAHAARNADANVIRNNILILSHNNTKECGWSMPAMLKKPDCGIKSECTARFLLPIAERTKYLEDPAS